MGEVESSKVVSWVVEVDIKPGELENFRTLMGEMVENTKQEPGTLAYEWFISDDGKSCHIYERYTDSPATMTHLAGFGSKWAERFMGCVDVTRLVVYGSPSDDVKQGTSEIGAQFLGPFGGFARE
jgi:quinol monooxygenase YgiN